MKNQSATETNFIYLLFSDLQTFFAVDEIEINLSEESDSMLFMLARMLVKHRDQYFMFHESEAWIEAKTSIKAEIEKRFPSLELLSSDEAQEDVFINDDLNHSTLEPIEAVDALRGQWTSLDIEDGNDLYYFARPDQLDYDLEEIDWLEFIGFTEEAQSIRAFKDL